MVALIRIFIFLLIFGMVLSPINAQLQRCGNIFRDNAFSILYEEKLKTHILKDLNKRSEIITIPVVFHMICNPDEQTIEDRKIYEQVYILNQIFSGNNKDIHKVPDEFKPIVSGGNIRFCLAKRSIGTKIETGIIRKNTSIPDIGLLNALYYSSEGGSDAWDTESYLNVWVAETGDYIAGFGTYPESVPLQEQGVVIHPKYFGINHSKQFNKGKTLVHEIGHYLGLQHIWDNNENCDAEDGLSDTPLQSHPYRACPEYPQFSCNSSDIFMNYMDYVDDACMYFFTKDQYDRMVNTIMLFRPQLIHSETLCFSQEKTTFEFNIYPNPSASHIQIHFTRPYNQYADLKIFTSIGECISSLKVFIYDYYEIYISDWSSGIYFITLNGEVKKLIKI